MPWKARQMILDVISFHLLSNAANDDTHKTTMSVEEPQPSENAIKITHDMTRVFRRPYMSLSFEMQTAKPDQD
jgi:hypothetical protein